MKTIIPEIHDTFKIGMCLFKGSGIVNTVNVDIFV